MHTARLARPSPLLITAHIALIPVLRHPVVMAQQVATTLDRIAEGRLVLGVGIAADAPSIRHEFTAAGVAFERRVGRFDDHLEW
ncbi:MAG: LLM class flavin-dependent oxidoreductase [Acidimicrobiales bacterium]